MNNLMKRIMSVAMAAITTTSPILSSYTIYASDITVNDDGTVTQMSTSTDSSMSEADETKFLFIKLKTAGGKVVLNEGEDQEQRIRLDKKTDGAEYIDVYDKNDVLISSESTKDNGYTYVYEAKIDDAVNVKAKADDGYTIKLYELTDDSSGTEIAEDVGFDAGNKVEAFKYPVFMEYDKTIKIGFERKESADDIAKDLSVNDEAEKDEGTKAEGATGKKEEAATETDTSKPEDLEAEHVKADGEAEDEISGDTKSKDTENAKKAENADVPEKSENSKNVDSNDKQSSSEEIATDSDLTVNADGNKKDDENADITVNDTDISKDVKDTDFENLDEITATTSEDAKITESPASDETSNNTDEDNTVNETEPDNKADDAVDKPESDKQDVEQSYDISNLDSTVFTSARLVVISDNTESISDDSKYIIANYQNIYLIQYDTVEDAMKAYVKYTDAGLTAEPDAPIIAASQDALAEDNDIAITEGNNPISMLAEEAENATSVISNKKIIALLDTGTLESPNVINRISLIDDSLNGNGHGDEMVNDIVEQNPDAEIISIRIMGNDGKGTISSILAGMEYAIEQNVDIINLSLYAKATISNSIIKGEVEKAVNNGIAVVAAAGNDGANVSNYIPGNIPEVWVIGACNVNGVRRGDSNYGKTVDYNVIANSTSEAAAKFSGYI